MRTCSYLSEALGKLQKRKVCLIFQTGEEAAGLQSGSVPVSSLMLGTIFQSSQTLADNLLLTETGKQ